MINDAIAFYLQQLDDLTGTLPAVLRAFQRVREERPSNDPLVADLRLADHIHRNRARQLEIQITLNLGK